MSLHEYPSVNWLTFFNSTSVILGAEEKNIFFRSSTFGVGTSTFMLILDNNAEHNREGWFVAHRKYTVFWCSLLMLSISCRIWLTMESLFWFPSLPLSRVRLSHSSRKRRHGECFIPSLNICMMFASLWPRYLENKFYILMFLYDIFTYPWAVLPKLVKSLIPTLLLWLLPWKSSHFQERHIAIWLSGVAVLHEIFFLHSFYNRWYQFIIA